MNIAETRDLFPYLKTGNIYMDHAAISPLSQPVIAQLNKYLYVRSESDIEDFNEYLRVVSDTKQKLGKMINCKSDRIAFVDNTSNGLNIIAQGIDWKRGDHIILNDLEFPSNVYPFLNLREYGVEIDIVKSKQGRVTPEDIERKISPRTRLISISYVQFLSGFRIDIKKLGKICKEQEIIFCVDAIQALGAHKLDVVESNIDFLASGTQKWLMALEGLGFIYITEELQKRIHPKYVGWTSVKDAWNLLNFDLTLKNSADRFQNGTLNSIGIFALNASLSLMFSLGLEKIEESVLNNTLYFIRRLQDAGLHPLLEDVGIDNLSGIISYQPDQPVEIFDRLKRNHITAALREGIIRFSPHFYNNKEEIDQVLELLKK